MQTRLKCECVKDLYHPSGRKIFRKHTKYEFSQTDHTIEVFVLNDSVTMPLSSFIEHFIYETPKEPFNVEKEDVINLTTKKLIELASLVHGEIYRRLNR